MKLYSFDPKKGKQILCGEIIGEALIRRVNSSHYMRVLDGYGIQEPAFQEAVEKGVKEVRLFVEPTGDKWKGDIKDWIAHGHVADYGHGKQRFLSMKYMKRYDTKLQ